MPVRSGPGGGGGWETKGRAGGRAHLCGPRNGRLSAARGRCPRRLRWAWGNCVEAPRRASCQPFLCVAAANYCEAVGVPSAFPEEVAPNFAGSPRRAASRSHPRAGAHLQRRSGSGHTARIARWRRDATAAGTEPAGASHRVSIGPRASPPAARPALPAVLFVRHRPALVRGNNGSRRQPAPSRGAAGTDSAPTAVG